MSQENVELVYRFTDAFNRRDLDSFLALCDAEVEYFSHLVELEGGGPVIRPERSKNRPVRG